MKLANLNRNGEESQPQPLRELTVEDVAMLPAAASTATTAITAAAAPAIRPTVVAATSSDGRGVGGMAAMKHIDTMQRQAEPDAGGLRQLGPEACRQIAAGALTALGTNLSSTFDYRPTDVPTGQRASLIRFARLIDY